MAEFTVLDRDRKFAPFYYDIMFDNRLKLQTRTVLMMILSRREGWDYSVRGMAALAGVSKDTMAGMIRELESAGYVKRDPQDRDGGKFGKAHYFVSSVPMNDGDLPTSPCPSFSDTEPPCPSSSDTVDSDTVTDLNNNNIYNTQDKEKEIKKKKKAGPKELDEETKELLRAYCGEDTKIRKALGDMICNRQALGAVNSKRAITAMLHLLERYSAGDRDTKLVLLDRAISNAWKTVYPLRDFERPPEADSTGWAEDKEVI